jgi:hypothetical protein
VDSPRACRSSVKPESYGSTTLGSLILRAREIFGCACGHEPSCPSQLHLIHLGASKTDYFTKCQHGLRASVPWTSDASSIGDGRQPRNGVSDCESLCVTRDPRSNGSPRPHGSRSARLAVTHAGTGTKSIRIECRKTHVPNVFEAAGSS